MNKKILILMSFATLNIFCDKKSDEKMIQLAKTGTYDDVEGFFQEGNFGSVFAKDENGFSPLVWAIIKGNNKVAKLLISKAGDLIGMVTKGGDTPLIKAVRNKNTELVKDLVKYGSKYINAQNNDGWTALMSAADLGSVELVSILLSDGSINKNLKNKKGQTARDIALYKGYNGVVDALTNG